MDVLNNRGIDFRIDVHASEIVLPGLQALLAKGFLVQTPIGGTLSDLLCGQLGIDAEYLKHRVQTLFLNSSPVDDTEKTIVTDGDVVALSAAMPGLVGATMRKGGFYARLRHGISHQIKDTKEIEQHMGIVTIRLFNVVAKELGPVFMEKGVKVDGRALQSFLNIARSVLTSPVYTLSVDGEETAMPVLLEKDWHMRMIRLTIQTVGDNTG
ncbi:MAG: hypothetical protein U9Q05_00355 [Thermodesulfobacteriota bacterium]|nr:hypothetical protein [Thermodesulfobacteriota bacterium]